MGRPRSRADVLALGHRVAARAQAGPHRHRRGERAGSVLRESSGFDAAYDWTGSLGHWAWQEAFADPARIVERLRPLLADGAAARALRFLDNNDTGARFVAQHGRDLTRVALGLLFTIPGVPLVYSGEEVCANFEPCDGTRATIDWRADCGLGADYEALIALRHRLPALRSSRLTLVAAAPAERVLAYLRTADDGSTALVVLDFGGATDARLELPPDLRQRRWTDVLAGEELSLRRRQRADASVRRPRPGAAEVARGVASARWRIIAHALAPIRT